MKFREIKVLPTIIADHPNCMQISFEMSVSSARSLTKWLGSELQKVRNLGTRSLKNFFFVVGGPLLNFFWGGGVLVTFFFIGTKDRPGTDHVISGPMRASKIAQTSRHPERRNGDSITESAKWGRFSEKF